jgi:hypothetical protein
MFTGLSGNALTGIGGMPSSNPSFPAPSSALFGGAAAPSFGAPAQTQNPSFGFLNNAAGGQYSFSSAAQASTGLFGGTPQQGGAFNMGGSGTSSFGYSSSAPSGLTGLFWLLDF